MSNEHRVFVPLFSEPFWRFKSGKKTVELRQASARWSLKNVPAGAPVLLRRGWNTKDELHGTVGRRAVATGWSALPEWARIGCAVKYLEAGRYIDPEGDILAFEVLLQREKSEGGSGPLPTKVLGGLP